MFMACFSTAQFGANWSWRAFIHARERFWKPFLFRLICVSLPASCMADNLTSGPAPANAMNAPSENGAPTVPPRHKLRPLIWAVIALCVVLFWGAVLRTLVTAI